MKSFTNYFLNHRSFVIDYYSVQFKDCCKLSIVHCALNFKHTSFD